MQTSAVHIPQETCCLVLFVFLEILMLQHGIRFYTIFNSMESLSQFVVEESSLGSSDITFKQTKTQPTSQIFIHECLRFPSQILLGLEWEHISLDEGAQVIQHSGEGKWFNPQFL